MAEFKTVMKEHDRMCRSFSCDCKDCPLGKRRNVFTCLRWIFDHPYEGEELIMQWAKENPPVTNRVKFTEVFGFDPIFLDSWSQRGGEWLLEEYKEPKKDD